MQTQPNEELVLRAATRVARQPHRRARPHPPRLAAVQRGSTRRALDVADHLQLRTEAVGFALLSRVAAVDAASGREPDPWVRRWLDRWMESPVAARPGLFAWAEVYAAFEDAGCLADAAELLPIIERLIAAEHARVERRGTHIEIRNLRGRPGQTAAPAEWLERVRLESPDLVAPSRLEGGLPFGIRFEEHELQLLTGPQIEFALNFLTRGGAAGFHVGTESLPRPVLMAPHGPWPTESGDYSGPFSGTIFVLTIGPEVFLDTSLP